MKHLFCILPGLFLGLGLEAKAASIGEPAPVLSVERWVKGSPVRVGAGTNVYVVEFWATWCPPCKRSIPHLTELQRKYADKGVIFIGVSDEPLADVVPFVNGQGDNMAYRVAVDTSKRSWAAWMQAYGQTGIPHAFVVDTQGRVVWHDFPNESLDHALERLLAGKLDLELARNYEGGERLLKQYEAMVTKPNAAAKAAPAGDKLLTEYSQDWRIPYRLARAILTAPEVRSRDLELGMRAATKAVELTHERSYQAMEMRARALFATGKKKEAVEAQKKAIELCDDPADKPDLEKFLKLFERGAQQ